MSPFTAELLGTALLVLLGNGVVANVVLARTKGHGAGWIVITFGWAMAVFVAIICTAKHSGAHLNPAVTLALATAGKFSSHFASWGDVPIYVGGQMIGGFIGGCLVFFFYKPHFDATDDAGGKLACFSTGPNIRSTANSFFCEMVGTMVLVLPLLLMVDPSLAFDLDATRKIKTDYGLGAIGALPVGLIILAIGLSLGGTTGYALNPARDLSPRFAHAILPIRSKGDSDWSYSWVPVAGPLAGGVLAALLVKVLVR